MSRLSNVTDTYIMILLVTQNKTKMTCSFVVFIVNFECEFICYQAVFGKF